MLNRLLIMLHRILDFSQNPIRLRTRLKQLVVQPENAPSQTIPFEDIDVILLSHPQITMSQSVLEEIADSGSVLIACNKKSLPVGMFLPLTNHHLPSRRIELQMKAAPPLRKRAWQQVVKAKIKTQGQLLQSLLGSDSGLIKMSQRVKYGDHENLEAQAARKYWSKLFSNFSFHRKTDGEDAINLRLNYGYGVLRGIISRSVCASGLIPAIGIHHHNQYNAYCLADDLMEPFRPLVDRVVYHQVSQPKAEAVLTPEVKAALIEPLLGRFRIKNGAQTEFQTIFETAEHIAFSLVQMYAKERDDLFLPESFDLVEEEKPF